MTATLVYAIKYVADMGSSIRFHREPRPEVGEVQGH
jgi:hypothetical protein